ncbi:non-canonical purine NTP pyrophosphatase [Candidatus Microgenomates bacterium]|nr:MAG: non-canonical purine NTP pyrophosphatase [Candidatus Microgenomates bacterium]
MNARKNIFFITGNKNKFQEAVAILPYIKQFNIDLTEVQEIDAHKIVAAKIHEAFKHKKEAFIVEDTSLYLDCLQGLPGPLIKWFLKTIGKDGLVTLVEKYKNNKAVAKSLIGFAESPTTIKYFEGEVEGNIVAANGMSGFGWDAVFQPKGSQKTFGQMSLQEKNKLDMNMRRRALLKLSTYLHKH